VFILGALAVLGGDSLTDFAVALLIGIAVGTYSSMFTASPLAIELHARSSDPPPRPTSNGATGAGSARPRTGGRSMRSAFLAVMAVSACLACGACATGAGPPPNTPAPAREGGSPAPGDAVPPAARIGEPSVLVRNLAVPWAIAFLSDGDALVTERDSARLLRVTPHGKVSAVGIIPGVDPYGEGGLLGVAVSPSFRRDRLVYVYFSAATDNRIVRFRYSGGLIGPLDPVVTGIPRAAIHNGGRLAFGPDGMLWAATGEHAEPSLAQDRDSLGGKILRMTPDGRPALGNPFGTLIWSLWVAALRGERLWQIPLRRTGAVSAPVAHFRSQ
jgi:glucose/arabinose dehydrogenase